MDVDDFSTNRHADTSIKAEDTVLPPYRHPDLWFSDGNIALVAGEFYFNVHRGVLCRNSALLSEAIEALAAENKSGRLIEGNIVLELADRPEDLSRFLTALYDGVSTLKYDPQEFEIVSSLLQLSTKYRVERLREDLLRGLSRVWPTTLQGWEFRESDATNGSGAYKPRSHYPHPILIINLARQTDALELLPSAFYDLSRCSASEIATGYLPSKSSNRSDGHHLTDADLLCVLRGREQASRFLSTFIVAELEGREPSPNCVYRSDPEAFRKRVCQAVFEATTFEVLRDVNGVVLHRSSDPLFALMDADMMQARTGAEGGRLNVLQRACEPCRMDLSASVDAEREAMWRKLPSWFGLDVPGWP